MHSQNVRQGGARQERQLNAGEPGIYPTHSWAASEAVPHMSPGAPDTGASLAFDPNNGENLGEVQEKVVGSVLAAVGKIAGIGGLALGVFVLIFRDVLTKNIIPITGLPAELAFTTIISLMFMTFGIAAIGIVAWLVGKAFGNRTIGLKELVTITVLAAIIIVSCVYVVKTISARAESSLGSRYESLIARGHTALAERNFPFAKEEFLAAKEVHPDQPDVYWGVGKANLGSGEYEEAKEFFNRAWELSKTLPSGAEPAYMFDVALSEEGISDRMSLNEQKKTHLLLAIDDYVVVENASAPEKEIYKDAIFSEGQLYLKLWLIDQKNTFYFDKATERFHRFSALRGMPELWNDYHLSCLSISIGKLRSNNDDIEEGRRYWESFNQKIKKYRGANAELYRAMQVRLVAAGDHSGWNPGDPVACPVIGEFIKNDM